MSKNPEQVSACSGFLLFLNRPVFPAERLAYIFRRFAGADRKMRFAKIIRPYLRYYAPEVLIS